MNGSLVTQNSYSKHSTRSTLSMYVIKGGWNDAVGKRCEACPCHSLYLARIETVYEMLVPDRKSFRSVKAKGSIIVAKAALRPYICKPRKD